jgi:hypothetical protein
MRAATASFVPPPDRPVGPARPAPRRIAEGPAPYRPRHPERSCLYRLFERHFEDYRRVHEQRFEPRDGPHCNVEMTLVAVLTDPPVVDAILRHLERKGGHDPFQPRAPPAA